MSNQILLDKSKQFEKDDEFKILTKLVLRCELFLFTDDRAIQFIKEQYMEITLKKYREIKKFLKRCRKIKKTLMPAHNHELKITIDLKYFLQAQLVDVTDPHLKKTILYAIDNTTNSISNLEKETLQIQGMVDKLPC